jgi:hypothetical protein
MLISLNGTNGGWSPPRQPMCFHVAQAGVDGLPEPF